MTVSEENVRMGRSRGLRAVEEGQREGHRSTQKQQKTESRGLGNYEVNR